ncbi:MAG: hypothetical protein NVS3B12_18280 [Acidimicrobiales bacterium]
MGNATTVSGPVTGGDRGWPFGCPMADLSPLGYRVEEFFIDGEATRYHGLAATPQGLVNWDPGRYGSLTITSEGYSYDIFTQAARAVGPDRDRTIDPLGGLDVRTVIAMVHPNRPGGWAPMSTR